MDINNILVSSGVSGGLYILYKGAIHLYKHYYLKSACHDSTLEITIVANEEPKIIKEVELAPLPEIKLQV